MFPTEREITAIYFKPTGELEGRTIGNVGVFLDDDPVPQFVSTDWHYEDETPVQLADLYGVEIRAPG